MDENVYSLSTPSYDRLENGYFKRLGYEALKSLAPKIRERAEACMKRARTLSQPRAVVRLAEVTQVSDTHIQSGELSIESMLWAGLAQKLDRPVTLAVFALTLGEDISRAAMNAREGALADAYFLFEAGSEIIEQTADALEKEIRGLSPLRGLRPSRRFSPGYCDLPLKNQRGIIQFLNPGALSIELTGSGAMVPEKTITAVQLFAPHLPWLSPCPTCGNKRCMHRREAQQSEVFEA